MVEVEAARAVNVDLSERLITFLDKVLTGTPAKGQLVNFWAFASFTLDDGVLGGFASGARTVVYKCAASTSSWAMQSASFDFLSNGKKFPTNLSWRKNWS